MRPTVYDHTGLDRSLDRIVSMIHKLQVSSISKLVSGLVVGRSDLPCRKPLKDPTWLADRDHLCKRSFHVMSSFASRLVSWQKIIKCQTISYAVGYNAF